MGLKLKDIISVVTDFVPLKGVAKVLGKGVGALLTKKVAKATGIEVESVEEVIKKTAEEIENDHEIRKAIIADFNDSRKHELDFFGDFANLDTGSQKLRARVRPALSLTLIGLFTLYGIVALFQQMFPYVLGMEFMVEFPPALVKITLTVIGFWFGGRTVEKAIGIIKNGK
ncbi:MAG: hypothetical protein ACXACF_01545 [Candidatus Hermodarchaeia archaeon]|jgi:hypothetical protein